MLIYQGPGTLSESRSRLRLLLNPIPPLAYAAVGYTLLILLAVHFITLPRLTPAQQWLARHLMTIAAAALTDVIVRRLHISSQLWRFLADFAAALCMYILTVLLSFAAALSPFPPAAFHIQGVVLSGDMPVGGAVVKLPREISPVADDIGRFDASLRPGERVRSIDVLVQERPFHIVLSTPVTGPSYVTLRLDNLTGSVEPEGVAP